MNDLILKMLTGVLRVALIPITRWLVDHDILTSDETVALVAELASWAIAIGWAAWAWYKSKQREHTALALPPGSTPNDITDTIADGMAAPAASAPDVAPRLSPSPKE